MNTRMYNKYQLQELQEAGWASKIASVAKGALDAGKGAGKAGSWATKGVGKVAGAAVKGFKGMSTGGKIATIGGALGAIGSLRKGRLAKRKADSAAMYGGGENPNPYAKRSIFSHTELPNDNLIDEGLLGGLAKGAALAGGAYLGYKGLQKLGSGSGEGGGGVGSALGKMWNKHVSASSRKRIGDTIAKGTIHAGRFMRDKLGMKRVGQGVEDAGYHRFAVNPDPTAAHRWRQDFAAGKIQKSKPAKPAGPPATPGRVVGNPANIGKPYGLEPETGKNPVGQALGNMRRPLYRSRKKPIVRVPSGRW